MLMAIPMRGPREVPHFGTMSFRTVPSPTTPGRGPVARVRPSLAPLDFAEAWAARLSRICSRRLDVRLRYGPVLRSHPYTGAEPPSLRSGRSPGHLVGFRYGTLGQSTDRTFTGKAHRRCGLHHALALTSGHRHDQSEALSLQRLLTAFIGTTSPSDSLSARRPFAFGL